MASAASIPIRVSKRLTRLCKERICTYFLLNSDFISDASVPGEFTFSYHIRPTDTIHVSVSEDVVELKGCKAFVEETETLLELLQISLTLELRNAIDCAQHPLGVSVNWRGVNERAKEFDSEVQTTNTGCAEPAIDSVYGVYILYGVEELTNRLRTAGYECMFYASADYDRTLTPIIIKKGLELHCLMFNVKTKLLAFTEIQLIDLLRSAEFLML